MIGFADKSTGTTHEASVRPDIAPVSAIPPAELNRLVARARAERSRYFAEWLKGTLRLWRSILPRRRSILPRGFSRWQTLPR